MEDLCKAIIAAAAVGGTVVLTPAVLTGIGFGATGIVAGSIAAQLISISGAFWLLELFYSIGATVIAWIAKMLWGLFGWNIANLISSLCNITVVYKDIEP